jgi:hypothetical protein
MFKIAEIDNAGFEFEGGHGVLDIMPKYKDVPAEFKTTLTQNKWVQLFDEWFFFGLKSLNINPKDGVDKDKALRHVRTIMRSFIPKHEHKTAACAWLLSEWFNDDVKWKKADPRVPE